MAVKRMITKSIIMNDVFLDMPLSARALYFHFCMEADDDGFIGNPKSLMRLYGASEDDLKMLISKRYILAFPSGAIVIKHWKMHNSIQKDRYKPTTYLEELSTLEVDERGAYTEKNDECYQTVNKMLPNCYQTVNKMETQTRLDKNRLDKISIEQTNKEDFTICQLLTNDEFKKLDQIYENVLDLIDLVDDSINSRQEPTPILNPYKYVVKVAESKGWCMK